VAMSYAPKAFFSPQTRDPDSDSDSDGIGSNPVT
jgi:hypothetical protein